MSAEGTLFFFTVASFLISVFVFLLCIKHSSYRWPEDQALSESSAAKVTKKSIALVRILDP